MARNKYDVDEELKKEFDLRQVKRLGGYIRPYAGKMILALLLRVTASAAILLLPIFLQKIIDVYIPMGKEGIPNILRVCGISVVLALYVSLVICIKTKLMFYSGQHIISDIRSDLFDHLQKLPFDYYDSRPHGKIQVRLVNYINNLSDLLSNGIVNTIVDLVSLVVIVAYMFYLDVRFTLVCLCGLPVLIGLVFLVKKKQRTAWQAASNKQSNLNAYISESINGIRVTKSFVREEENTGIFNRLSASYRSSWLQAIKYNLILPPSVDFMSVVTISLVYVIGVQLLKSGSSTMSVGAIVAFTSYIGTFWTPITNLGNFYNSLLTAIAYLEMIFETMDEPVVVEDKEGAGEMPQIRGDVEFKDVCFSYEEGVQVLNHVDLHVKPGQTCAVVGPTGAGKTTIISLISRFYNVDAGGVYVDGINVEDVTIRSLRKQMGVMLQDSFIFAGTIGDNIRYGKLDATREEIEQAARVVCAHDFIQKMEAGYDTMVNERGSRLSAGERQLISFARALLADPRILILDEATSSIDTETELALQQGLKQLLKGRTSFIIAHRLSTIQNADVILYVDHGRILERGTHEELLEKRGYYYNLYAAQRKSYI